MFYTHLSGKLGPGSVLLAKVGPWNITLFFIILHLYTSIFMQLTFLQNYTNVCVKSFIGSLFA